MLLFDADNVPGQTVLSDFLEWDDADMIVFADAPCLCGASDHENESCFDREGDR